MLSHQSFCLISRRDFGKYLELARSFSVYKKCGDLFEMLRELGNVYLVKPENLRSVMDQGQLGRYSFKSLYPYLMMRTDFKSANLEEIAKSKQ